MTTRRAGTTAEPEPIDAWEAAPRRADLLSVGAFGRRTRLSRKALRIYDELGLLRPAWVEPSSGYRFYGPEQSERALRIRLLRDLGMPLEAIRAVLDAPTPDAAITSLAAWWAGVERRVADGRRIVSYLSHRLERREDTMTVDVTLQQLPAQHVLSRAATVSVDALDEHVRTSIAALRERADAHRVAPAAAPFAIYRAEVTDTQPGEVEVCLPVGAAVAGPDGTRVVPGTSAAVADVAARDADYPAILGVYESIAGWIEGRGRRIADDPREVFLREPAERGYSEVAGSEPVIRIIWPVA